MRRDERDARRMKLYLFPSLHFVSVVSVLSFFPLFSFFFFLVLVFRIYDVNALCVRYIEILLSLRNYLDTTILCAFSKCDPKIGLNSLFEQRWRACAIAAAAVVFCSVEMRSTLDCVQ